jgi:hypothetical protein
VLSLQSLQPTRPPTTHEREEHLHLHHYITQAHHESNHTIIYIYIYIYIHSFHNENSTLETHSILCTPTRHGRTKPRSSITLVRMEWNRIESNQRRMSNEMNPIHETRSSRPFSYYARETTTNHPREYFHNSSIFSQINIDLSLSVSFDDDTVFHSILSREH